MPRELTSAERQSRRRELLRQLERELDAAAAELLRSSMRAELAAAIQRAREILKLLDEHP